MTYSTAPRVISPMLFVDKPMAAGTDKFYVQSPNGFRANDRVVVIGMNGNCELTLVTAVTPGDSVGNVTTGIVGISHPGTANLYLPGGQADGSRLLNLGQQRRSRRARSSMSPTGSFAPPICSRAAPAVPIAQNVVLMKAQYGIDCGGNGVVVWTTATATNICGDGLNYTPDDFMPLAPAASAWNGPALARIRAIRIGIVVRSDEPDLKDARAGRPDGRAVQLLDATTPRARAASAQQHGAHRLLTGFAPTRRSFR